MMRLLLSSLLLTACVRGPNYERPSLMGLFKNRWKHAETSRIEQPLPDEWWRAFGSSTLNNLVSKALAANLDLEGARERVEIARALLGVKRADWFPQLGSTKENNVEHVSASGLGANFPQQLQGSTYLLDRLNFRSTLDMSYELDLWGRVRRNVESAEASLRAEEETLLANRLIVASEVARHYFLIRSTDAQIKVLNETITHRDEALNLQKSRFNGGMANEMDVTRARAELALAKADLASSQRQRGSAEHALAVLCGQSPSDFSLAPNGALQGAPKFPANMPSTLLQSRPDIRAAEAQLQAACADIGVAEASFFPSFKLLGSAGLESVDTKDMIAWQNRVLSLGPSIHVPIFEGGRLRSNLKMANSRYRESLANYKKTILTALREVEDALLDLQGFSSQREATLVAMQAAIDTSDLARVRHEKGLANYFEVVVADRTVLATKLLVAQLDGQMLVSSVLLAKAMGGGWQR